MITTKDLLAKSKTKQQQAATTEPAKPAASPKGFLATALANAKNKPAQQAAKPAAKPVPVSQPRKAATPKPASAATASDDPLAGIGAISMDLSASSMPDTNLANYQYQEQAEACDDATSATFYELMHQVVNSFKQPDQLIEHLNNTRQYLQEHDHLKAILKPEDVQYMVRALRSTYGSALASRTANKKKRSATAQKVDDVLTDLGGLTF